jgi:hypothetical protein
LLEKFKAQNMSYKPTLNEFNKIKKMTFYPIVIASWVFDQHGQQPDHFFKRNQFARLRDWDHRDDVVVFVLLVVRHHVHVLEKSKLNWWKHGFKTLNYLRLLFNKDSICIRLTILFLIKSKKYLKLHVTSLCLLKVSDC